MKKKFTILICILILSCSSSENTSETSFETIQIDNINKELVRTFQNDYSLWISDDQVEYYEDLRNNLGVFITFETMREAQYRDKGIITDLNQIQSVIDSGKPTFLEGWSETCVYCKMGEIALKNLRKDHGQNVNFVVVDVSNRYLEDVTPTLIHFGIISTPTYIIFDKDGEEIFRSVGYAAEGEKLSKILSDNY